MACLAVAMLVGLPELRKTVWGKEGPTTRTSLNYDPALRAEQEKEIQEAMKIDTSRYERSGDVRYVDRLPSTETELEAAFRLRKPDCCEKIGSGESIFLVEGQTISRGLGSQFLSNLQAIRRPVMSIGLDVSKEDRDELPKLSKNQILRFLSSSWVSLQARLYVDPERNEWRLHYRPLAAQASFEDSRAHLFESAIDSTLEDIRGLGMLKHENPLLPLNDTENNLAAKSELESNSTDPGAESGVENPEVSIKKPTVVPQTAAWLFRYDRQAVGDMVSMKAFEFVFVHITPKEGPESGGEPWNLHLFFTTDGRRTLHYFSPESAGKIPTKADEASLQAAINFTKYGSGGLSPTDSVTRSIKVNSTKQVGIDKIDGYLKTQGLTGSWLMHVPESLEAMIRGL
jgi:hypothetical protein